MLRSVLLALDDAPGAQAARDLGFALARRLGATVTAAAVLDRPHTLDAHEAVPLGASAYAERRNAKLAEQMEAEAAVTLEAAQAAAGNLGFATLRLEGAPEPALLQASAGHDLIVLGRDSTLGREETDDGLAPVVEALLRDGARPLLVVPPGADVAAVGPVLVGYDGSRPAQRTLLLFALLGLAEGSPVKLLSAHAKRSEATRLAAEGAGFLRGHGLTVEEWAVTGDHPVDLLLAEAATLPARLLVIGAFGHGGLRVLLLGTATRLLLRDAPCPVFVSR